MSLSLPPFYSHWLSAAPASQTPQLDCLGDCERLSSRVSASERFLEATKCCTHFPFLPNFAVGAMLSRGGLVKTRVEIAMRQGVVTPLGLFPTLAREARKLELGANSFGRELELVCPLYDCEAGGCGIWEFRPGVCATYFCVSAGAERLLREQSLNLFEWTLAHEVLWRQGFLQKEIDAMEKARSHGVSPEASWLEHASRKESFFLDCTRLAFGVTRSEIADLMGNA